MNSCFHLNLVAAGIPPRVIAATWQTESTANLSASLTTIWWMPPTPGFTLPSTASLSPTNWVTSPSGTNNPATIPATLPARFYRLFKP